MGIADNIGIVSKASYDEEANQAVNLQTGFYDMVEVDISGSASEDIDLDSLLGSTVVVRTVMNNTATDGNVLMKTLNDSSSGYVTVPLNAGVTTGLLPVIKYIKKTGSVDSVICFTQKIVE